jgi:hypothetical protein
MTLIAGIISRKERTIPVPACESLRQSISRHSDDEVTVFKGDRSYFVKLDIRAFGEPGVFVDLSGGLSMVAGEPLLSVWSGETCQSREKDLQLIHEGLMRDDREILRKAEGTFCAVTYEPRSGTLNLIADKLGLRPLYYWMDNDYLVFASALRILENLSIVPKAMSLRAVTDIVALGCPMGDRTPYVGISILKSAEVLSVNGTNVSRRPYWRWDEIETSSRAEPELLREVYERFQSGVRRRANKQRATVAYLSGGLDSRCVVAGLVEQGIDVHTFNFARPGTQDQIFGNAFAEKIGTVHQAIPKQAGDQIPDYASLLSQTWNARRDCPSERPAPLLVWSGEGGSLGLGHIHMNQAIIDLMRAKKIDDAMEEFFRCEYVHLPAKLFKPKTLKVIAGLIKAGVRAELDDLHGPDPARNFYLFLLLNDQRRKLANHFENIDLNRVEFHLPFFDAAFLTSIIRVPIDLCMYHKFYTKWLAHFSPVVTSVPWQAYPDHEPCPLPIPAGLAYQWDEKYQAAERAFQKERVMKQAMQLLNAIDFPREIMSKRKLRLATWIHGRGWRDYEHVIKTAHTYYSYWSACKGVYV